MQLPRVIKIVLILFVAVDALFLLAVKSPARLLALSAIGHSGCSLDGTLQSFDNAKKQFNLRKYFQQTTHLARRDPAGFDRDGVVWCVDYAEAHRRLPPVLRSALKRESAEVFTTEMLASVAASPRDLDALAGEPFLLFLDPPSLDARIVNQFALFSLMSGAGTRLRDWLERHSGMARAVIVPASLKWEVRDRLDQINVTERVLFPGLDGLSRWLTRYYAPRVSPRRSSRARETSPARGASRARRR